MLCESGRNYRIVTALIERAGRYLITQRCGPEVLVGLWEFPNGVVGEETNDEATIQHVLRKCLGIDATVGKLRACRSQKYVGYSVEVALYEVAVPSSPAPRPLTVADFRWVAPTELEQYPFIPSDQATTDLVLGIRREHPRDREANIAARESDRS